MLAIYSCSNACTEYGACVSGSAMEYERGGGDDRGEGGPSGPEPRSEAPPLSYSIALPLTHAPYSSHAPRTRIVN